MVKCHLLTKLIIHILFTSITAKLSSSARAKKWTNLYRLQFPSTLFTALGFNCRRKQQASQEQTLLFCSYINKLSSSHRCQWPQLPLLDQVVLHQSLGLIWCVKHISSILAYWIFTIFQQDPGKGREHLRQQLLLWQKPYVSGPACKLPRKYFITK